MIRPLLIALALLLALTACITAWVLYPVPTLGIAAFTALAIGWRTVALILVGGTWEFVRRTGRRR